MWATLVSLMVLVAAAAARPSNGYWNFYSPYYPSLQVGRLPTTFGNQPQYGQIDRSDAVTGVASDVCSLTVEKGPCKAAIPQYAFFGGRCQEFLYGGCQGNANNFETLGECQQACGGKAARYIF